MPGEDEITLISRNTSAKLQERGVLKQGGGKFQYNMLSVVLSKTLSQIPYDAHDNLIHSKVSRPKTRKLAYATGCYGLCNHVAS